MIQTIENFSSVDTQNMQTYSKYGTSRSEELMYTCTTCGKQTCISDSYSSRGHRIICNRCVSKYFRSFSDVFNWIGESEA